MWIIILTITFLCFVSTVTWLSYYLGKTKTENPITSAIIGFLLSFFPLFGLIYLVVLSLKEEVTTV